MDEFTYDIIRNGEVERTVTIKAEDLDKADEQILKEKDDESTVYLSGLRRDI